MEDKEIVNMYLARDENAIACTREKYGGFCFKIAYNILSDREDSEECVNDTYLSAWNSIPPNVPELLSVFLAKITRRLSISKLRANTALKRDRSRALQFEELAECLQCSEKIYEKLEAEELKNSIRSFLKKLSKTERMLFVCRYFYFYSINELSGKFHFSESKVKTTLHRSRIKLRKHLEKEGLFYDR